MVRAVRWLGRLRLRLGSCHATPVRLPPLWSKRNVATLCPPMRSEADEPFEGVCVHVCACVRLCAGLFLSVRALRESGKGPSAPDKYRRRAWRSLLATLRGQERRQQGSRGGRRTGKFVDLQLGRLFDLFRQRCRLHSHRLQEVACQTHQARRSVGLVLNVNVNRAAKPSPAQRYCVRERARTYRRVGVRPDARMRGRAHLHSHLFCARSCYRRPPLRYLLPPAVIFQPNHRKVAALLHCR